MTAFPSELSTVKEFLAEQGSNLDAASCLLRGNLCFSFSLDLANAKKEKDRMAAAGNCCAPTHTAVLHSQAC